MNGWGSISPPQPGFDPRTVQPVAGRYTDWAIAAARELNIEQPYQKYTKPITTQNSYNSATLYKLSQSIFLSNSRIFPKERCFLDEPQSRPVRPYGKGHMTMTISTEYFWKYVDRKQTQAPW